MNYNGWGLRMELVFILVFLICLAFSTIGLNKMGLLGNSNTDPSKEPISNFNYENLEIKLYNATREYVNKEYSNDIDDETIVKLSTLYFRNYITKLYDENNNECSGYTRVRKVNENIIYNSYIKCDNYTTSGYEGTNDW